MKRNYEAVCALLIAACAGCADYQIDEEVGTATAPIINGWPATADQIYATVGIYSDYVGAVICTGTLIAPNVVTTAAHCFFGPEGEYLGDPRGYAAVYGLLNMSDVTADDAYWAQSVAVHGDYQNGNLPEQLAEARDIAVLVLEQPIDAPVAPVLMDQAFGPEQGAEIIISGYGEVDEDPNTSTSGVLNIATTPYTERVATEFAAGGQGHSDTCQGDSGGPAYLNVGETTFVVGATSRGVGCGNGGIYTALGAYDGWIREVSGGAYEGAVDPTAKPQSSRSNDDAEPQALSGCSIGRSDAPPAAWLMLMIGAGLIAARRRHGIISL